MFPKKMVMIVGVIVLIAVNIIVLSVSNRRYQSYGPGRIAISLIAPFQEAVSRSIRFVKNIWVHYFFLVETAKENDNYRKALSHAVERNNLYKELKLSNIRLRSLLDFQKTITDKVIAAEVIGKDPSPWFKTIMINKGKDDGVKKGAAVVIPEGIVGQVAEVSLHNSKVLLIIDHNSAVDALVQRSRARGIIKGGFADRCFFKYVLRKKGVAVGDTVVSSGLDGVFLKGLPLGQVSGVVKPNSGIFQEVTVTPCVDFEKLEEVLVVLNLKKHKFQSEQ
ncbi:MAG: rod shape-determining protein MreC [Deltaproteobacteria bacterium]|nr:rod shape-determining protein MreC [Deltaproteobacteria bacterium]MBW2679820.1 rod shape-determining protein MreC [Deltaproteobacteria bacterium]